jgi:L-seryl-tRNA(Ser) seleniumtransferase
MFDSIKRLLSRRDLFRGGALAGAAFAPRPAAAATSAGKLQLGPDLYRSIGVRPVINCRGTLTVISGSLELPEVRAAVDNGGQKHVVLDELMEAIAKRLAELTGAEWAPS